MKRLSRKLNYTIVSQVRSDGETGYSTYPAEYIVKVYNGYRIAAGYDTDKLLVFHKIKELYLHPTDKNKIAGWLSDSYEGLRLFMTRHPNGDKDEILCIREERDNEFRAKLKSMRKLWVIKK